MSFLKGGSESNLVLRHSSFCAGHYVVYKNQKKTHCVSISTTLIHSINWEGEIECVVRRRRRHCHTVVVVEDTESNI